jgi:hypothetical protein
MRPARGGASPIRRSVNSHCSWPRRRDAPSRRISGRTTPALTGSGHVRTPVMASDSSRGRSSGQTLLPMAVPRCHYTTRWRPPVGKSLVAASLRRSAICDSRRPAAGMLGGRRWRGPSRQALPVEIQRDRRRLLLKGAHQGRMADWRRGSLALQVGSGKV